MDILSHILQLCKVLSISVIQLGDVVNTRYMVGQTDVGNSYIPPKNFVLPGI